MPGFTQGTFNVSTTAIATFGDAPASKYGPEDTNQDDFVKGSTFHAQLRFFSDAAKIVKKKLFPANHWAFVIRKGEMKDLGDTVAAAVLGYRYKAVDFSDLANKKVKTYYDPDSPEFKAVKKEAERKLGEGEQSKAMAGAEFLLYIDGHGYATLLCGNASLKMCAKKLFPMAGKSFASFGHNLVDGKYTYEAPNVTLFEGSFELPDAEKRRKVVDEFINATGSAESEPEPEPGEDETPATDAPTRQR